MGFYKRYAVLIGIFFLTCIVILLFSTPSVMFSSGVSFVDTELYRSSGNETYVTTKMDFGDNELVASFPSEMGEWEGYDYDSTGAAEQLGADVMLMRGYTYAGLYQPIFFLIMQARTESSFHPPTVCYPSQGYEIEEESSEQVLVTDIDWVGQQNTADISIPVKKLVVYKESKGNVTERRVVFYWYVKSNQFTSDTITMIRVSALAPIQGSYEGILDVMKSFTSDAFPHMFEVEDQENGQTLAARLTDFGIPGYLAIAFAICAPLSIIVYPGIRRIRGSRERPKLDV